MSVEVVDCKQGEPEWFAARCGLPTASMFGTVMAKGKTAGSVSETRRKYLYQLAGELITGQPTETYSNPHMERGKIMEAEARNLYAMLCDDEIREVGFIRNGRKGASPDCLVGQPGGLEIKTKLPSLMIECMLRDDIPPEHKAQVQGNLWVAEREWWDLLCYWPKMAPVIHRVTRDNGYIANLAGEVDRFNDDLDVLVERVRRYGEPQQVAA